MKGGEEENEPHNESISIILYAMDLEYNIEKGLL